MEINPSTLSCIHFHNSKTYIKENPFAKEMHIDDPHSERKTGHL